MTNLLITHSVQDEVDRVRFTVSKLPWYGENGYKVDLPSGITEHSSESEITEKTVSGYLESEYESAGALLQKAWQDFLPRIERIKNDGVLPVGESYTVKLTSYGTGGSYFPDKRILILKFKNKTPETMLGTVVHEIVHMCIQPLIDEFAVSHWHKERLVDLIVEHYSPGLKTPQKIKEDVRVVDDSFQKFFPDLRKLASSLAN